MSLSFTACAGSDESTSSEDTSSVVIRAGDKFDETSVYYAYDDETQSTLSVREGTFKFMSADSGYKHAGDITDGEFSCDKEKENDECTGVTYEVGDGNITVTADGSTYTLNEVTDGQYGVYAQLINSKVCFHGEEDESTADTELEEDTSSDDSSDSSLADDSSTPDSDSDSSSDADDSEAYTPTDDETSPAGEFLDDDKHYMLYVEEESGGNYDLLLTILSDNPYYYNGFDAAYYFYNGTVTSLTSDSLDSKGYQHYVQLTSGGNSGQTVNVWWNNKDSNGDVKFHVECGDIKEDAVMH
jgi:hypothetical protein